MTDPQSDERPDGCSSYLAYTTVIKNAGGLLDPRPRSSYVTPGPIIKDAGALIDRGLDDA